MQTYNRFENDEAVVKDAIKSADIGIPPSYGNIGKTFNQQELWINTYYDYVAEKVRNMNNYDFNLYVEHTINHNTWSKSDYSIIGNIISKNIVSKDFLFNAINYEKYEKFILTWNEPICICVVDSAYFDCNEKERDFVFQKLSCRRKIKLTFEQFCVLYKEKYEISLSKLNKEHIFRINIQLFENSFFKIIKENIDFVDGSVISVSKLTDEVENHPLFDNIKKYIHCENPEHSVYFALKYGISNAPNPAL